jgi:hypothetical protein
VARQPFGHADLDRLHDLAAEIAEAGDDATSVFGDIGLFLAPSLGRATYDTTPMNSSTFASTGGDGVHFGLLHVEGKVVDTSPVVMTVPMCFGRPNAIVGETLREFLSLGALVGFWYLEHYVYSEAEFFAKCGAPETMDDLADLIVADFDLVPWPDVRGHMTELQALYASAIVLKA